MKLAPKFYTGNTDQVLAYQDADLAKYQTAFKLAEAKWLETWRAQGAEDRGSCCGGKGIQIWYLPPRKRIAEARTIVPCSWVQGNISAQRSVDAALADIRKAGLEAWYYDGWMD